MKLKAIVATVVVLAMANSAQAVSLVVMAVNTSDGIAGAKTFTIGVQITAADVAAGGQNAVLFVQNLTVTGGANGPIQQLGGVNKPDVQTLQTSVLDGSAVTNGGPPDPIVGTAGNNAFYRDTWWYNSAGGALQGVVDSAGDSGTVTTVPAGDGSGVYTVGFGGAHNANSGTNALGVTGYTFQPSGSPGAVPANGTNDQTITYSGLFGVTGANYLDPSPGGPFTDPNHILGDLLVANHGTLTVPILQLVAKGDVSFPSTPGDAGTFLEVGTQIYNVFGGPQSQDAFAYLDFANNRLSLPLPEPGTFVLAGLGAIGVALAWKRRK